MELYGKIIRPYLEGYKATHGEEPEFMKDYNGRWFDESLRFEIIRDLIRKVGFTEGTMVHNSRRLTQEYNLRFEERYIELVAIPKDNYLQGRVISDIDEFRTRILKEEIHEENLE